MEAIARQVLHDLSLVSTRQCSEEKVDQKLLFSRLEAIWLLRLSKSGALTPFQHGALPAGFLSGSLNPKRAGRATGDTGILAGPSGGSRASLPADAHPDRLSTSTTGDRAGLDPQVAGPGDLTARANGGQPRARRGPEGADAGARDDDFGAGGGEDDDDDDADDEDDDAGEYLARSEGSSQDAGEDDQGRKEEEMRIKDAAFAAREEERRRRRIECDGDSGEEDPEDAQDRDLDSDMDPETDDFMAAAFEKVTRSGRRFKGVLKAAVLHVNGAEMGISRINFKFDFI